MPGKRDGNLRSGDLHEELGIFLLKAISFVAPVPRQEDVGNDAFATLIRPEGNRRLIPDLSFLVQLKSASVGSVRYTTSDEMSWIVALEVPLFIGRVNIKKARIELFSTQRLHEIILEHSYKGIELLLDVGDETSATLDIRRANLGPPVHAWSTRDINESDFLSKSHAVLRLHVERLRRNRLLRGIQTLKRLRWETGKPPTENGEMMLFSGPCDIADTLRDMMPHVRRLLVELQRQKSYGDFSVIAAFFDLMRRWGADLDPDGTLRIFAAMTAEGPQISVEEAIQLRYAANPNQLDLRRLSVTNDSLASIPTDVRQLALVDALVTDEGIRLLLRMEGLTRLNLAGTKIIDDGLWELAKLPKLEWICVNRTPVTTQGVERMKKSRQNVTVMIGSEP